MNSNSRASLRRVANLPYLHWVREQLEVTKTRVRRWIDWDPDLDQYEAFYHSRQVSIPVPECDWSFLVCLHEIGHISTGERCHSYLAEYNAERWAIKRGYDWYGVYNNDYVQDAKRYVQFHLIQDIVHYDLGVERVKPCVLDWIGITAEQVLERVQECVE